MLDSPMIDVALGLILFFLVMSLSVTAVQEWISSVFKLKGKNLKEGIENLVGKNITENIYNHPLMETMGTKTFYLLVPFQKIKYFIYKKIGKEIKEIRPTPSYLKSKYFFRILFDIIDPDKKLLQKEQTDIKELIERIPDSNSQLKKVIQSLNIKTDNKIETIEKEISEWFESGMERASGWYKRKMQFCSFCISFVLVIILNANTITIAETLWKNDELRAKTVAITTQISKENISELHSKTLQEKIGKINTVFPIGWKKQNQNWSVWENIKERVLNLSFSDIIGWFITISAISLGAPFWFDLLKKVASLRQSKTSQKPKKA